MKSFVAPFAGAGLAVLMLAGFTAAATPAPATPGTTAPAPAVTPAPAVNPAPATTGPIAAILGLTDAQVMQLRMAGKSLAQIAEQQKVDPQKLIDALVAQWSARIDARLAAGAITADQAATLKANLAVQAKSMVNQAAMGGMRGAAVGAGPNGTMRGGMGGGMGRGGAMGGGMGGAMGAGRGRMNGAAGTGTCPYATTAPSS